MPTLESLQQEINDKDKRICALERQIVTLEKTLNDLKKKIKKVDSTANFALSAAQAADTKASWK